MIKDIITYNQGLGSYPFKSWRPSLFERQRRVLMTASMMGIHGTTQREGEVVHLVAQRLFDFSADLASLEERDSEFPVPHGAAIKSSMGRA